MLRIRLWLAIVLYRLACRLSGQCLERPMGTEAVVEYNRLRVLRAERIAMEWKERYKLLRAKNANERASSVTVF